MAPEPQRPLLISYLTLRRIIGILGIALPFVCWIGAAVIGCCNWMPQQSISNYYHTIMGDVFVGLLCAISLFLFVYKGHEAIDGIMGNVAGILGLIVAFFPTTPKCNNGADYPCTDYLDCNHVLSGVTYPNWIGYFHLICAGIFLLVLAYFSIALFTKSTPGIPPTPQKLRRNTLYRICGWVMVACVVLLICFFAFVPQQTRNEWAASFQPVFWLETISLIAFGLAWLVKGEWLMRDE